MTKAAKRVWMTPALIFVVVLIPLIFAVLVYFRPAWFALGHTNHGQLVRPPVKIAVKGLMQAPGTAAPAAAKPQNRGGRSRCPASSPASGAGSRR